MRLRTALFLLLFFLPACGDSQPLQVQKSVGLSTVLRIDRIYKSMAGPSVQIRDLRLQSGPPELLWLTAYRTKVVGEDGGPVSQEFMCHNSLDMRWEQHAALFGWEKRARAGRTFTTSQGQFGVELPDGYGIPVLSNEPLEIASQVLNHNIPDLDLGVRHEVTIEYVKDSEARGRLKPLFPSNAFVMALVEGESGVYAVEHPNEHQEAASCLPGVPAPQATAMRSKGLVSDFPGRQFTGHWVVPPGREVRHTLVSRMLDLPFDTTVHYIATHLHPFAESLELRDLTTGETLFRANATGLDEGIGLSHIDPFSSVEGIPLYRAHDYEMVSTYDNTSGIDQDAMAAFVFFLHDKEAEAGLKAIREKLAGGHEL
jgi:hypothetical protein